MAVNERVDELFRKYLNGSCTQSEWNELLALLAAIDEDDAEILTQPLYELWNETRGIRNLPSGFDREKLYRTITSSADEPVWTAKHKTGWRFEAAAAILLGVIFTALLFYFNRKNKPQTTVLARKATTEEHVQPGSSKAILTLADGRQVSLDDAANEVLSQINDVKITNRGGKLAYEGSRSSAAATALHTVTTARANQYHLVLQDGTQVWLNAASSIRFPPVFGAASRVVEVTGEAYFEVAHDASRPFHVKVDGTDIEVLGTHFNVNCYADEETMKTSLLEGAIRIKTKTGISRMSPGQQVEVRSTGDFSVHEGNVDMSAAWVSGYFHFDQTPLPTIMRQIGRWYDLEIKYEGDIPDRIFKGKIQRSLPLSGILNLLRKGDVRFRLEDKTLIITE